MQNARTVGNRGVQQMLRYLPLMLGFALLGSNTSLQAASKVSAVVEAAQADDLTQVLKLIEQRADVNQPANDGSSALLWAAYHSNLEMTKALLAAGASVDNANNYGVNPLLQASRNGDVEVMRALLDAGANATRWHPEGETPLMAASRTGRVDAVELLLSHGSFVNAVDPFQEQTALMWASAEGHAEVVKTLLAAGADPDLQAHVSFIKERRNADHPSGGFTALMFAARNGHLDVVTALMQGGADPKLTNADGATATIIAIYNDRFDLAKEMLDLGADPNDGSLYFAVEMHDQTTDTRAQDATRMQPDHPNQLTALSLVKALMDLGADVNKPFVGSLHSTSMCCGAPVNSSPFYRAAIAADVEVLKLMIENGAEIEWSPSEIKPEDGKGPVGRLNGNVGQTPLLAALKGGKGPAIQGGPGYIRQGDPPYREAGSRKPAEALHVLLAAGADPNVKMKNGSTALHEAVKLQKVDLIRELAGAGAALDAVDKANKTPLLLAEDIDEGPPKEPNQAGEDAYIPQKDSKAQLIAVLRELMNLGPDDPTPQPPPAAAEAKVSVDGATPKISANGSADAAAETRVNEE